VPIIGLLSLIFQHLKNFTIHDRFVELHQKYGKTFAYHVMGKPFVATIEPKVIEYFLKGNFENFIKGSAFRDPFTDLLGNGIFNVDGHLWNHQRKVSSKMFTKKQFEGHIYQAVKSNTAKVCDIMSKSKGEQLDMFNLMNRYTLDTIGEIGFSKNIGSLEDPTSPFLKSFDHAQQGMLKRFWSGQGVEVWKLFRMLGLFWEGGRESTTNHINTLNDYCNGIVDELIDKASKGDDNSFVGMFIKDTEGANMLKNDEKKFRVFIRDMVLNFLIAGRDTTAQCLTWTVFELAQAPHVVKKAREEVDSICGDQPVTYEDLQKLRYIQAVLDEGLRLHPSVPMDGKISINGDTLPSGPDGIKIAPGTIIQYNAYSQGRDKDTWGEDSFSFRPDRWLERTTQPTTFEFTAFHAGPRECLGRRLAQAEMKTFVANFVRDFDFKLAVPPAEVKYDAQLTLGCSTGCPMIITSRK
jgi:cytochrome P450